MGGSKKNDPRRSGFIRWSWLVLALSLWLPVSSHAQGASADSADFTLNTTGIASGIGGSAYADSADFTLNTTGIALGMGGTAYVDSADFTLNTTGVALGSGGTAFADSGDFTLNTGGAMDIGLRIQDGAATIHIACEPAGTLTSPLRIRKGGTTYGILLVDPASPDASRIHIQTGAGRKALQKLP